MKRKCFEAGAYAGQLHDAFYAYAKALNSTLQRNSSDYSNGRAILKNLPNEFQGISGKVVMSENGIRKPFLYFDGLNKNGKQILIGTVFVDGSKGYYTPEITDEADIWHAWGGKKPLAVPVCGFLGNQKPRGT
ncbi:hypothetical protein OESDEN_20812 [Oesophagostomum dentatum]|uniref:Receptor ligand binding region domain-containing protein n=1 Tax=Oesophagostomum dentatum TaxID=61180 RepID=A0A0B1S7P8_OESDE|nr:hypothetical protein OESDEN_20819 [Oesophagostomum dentatum]KHJ79539.1 hypothetical protein OESDEN_20812 [Oesophagostomum dentatum]